MQAGSPTSAPAIPVFAVGLQRLPLLAVVALMLTGCLRAEPKSTSMLHSRVVPGSAAASLTDTGPYPLAEAIDCGDQVYAFLCAGSELYCSTANAETDAVRCFDRRTGAQRWSTRFSDPDNGQIYPGGPLFLSADGRHLACIEEGKTCALIQTYSTTDGAELAEANVSTAWRAAGFIPFDGRELFYVVDDFAVYVFEPATLERLAHLVFDDAAPAPGDYDAWRHYTPSCLVHAVTYDAANSALLATAPGAGLLLRFPLTASATGLAIDCLKVPRGDAPEVLVLLPGTTQLAVLGDGRLTLCDRRTLQPLPGLPVNQHSIPPASGLRAIADARVIEGSLLVLCHAAAGAAGNAAPAALYSYALTGELLQSVALPGARPVKFIDGPGADRAYWLDGGAYLEEQHEYAPSSLHCIALPSLEPRWVSEPLAPMSGAVWIDRINNALYALDAANPQVVRVHSLPAEAVTAPAAGS